MIVGRTPAETVQAAREELQRAVSCVTSVVLTVQVNAVETKLNLVSRLPRTTGGEAITLDLRHSFCLVHDVNLDARSRWQARTTGYLYALQGVDGREILAYHWHPAGRSPVTAPHLHLGTGAGVLRHELEKAHLTTGFVTPVALLTLVINHFGARPRRADWPAVLQRADVSLSMT